MKSEYDAQSAKLRGRLRLSAFSFQLFTYLLVAFGLVLGFSHMLVAQETGTQAVKKRLKPGLELGTQTYNRYCTMCHGINGDGKGFNADHLYVLPANHGDSEFMSTRSDDKLYDVINMGGKGISKSVLMPPWGATIGDARIESLIIKLRDICKCTAKE